MQKVACLRTYDLTSWITHGMEAVFAQSHRPEPGSSPQVSVAGSGDVGMDDGTISGDRDFQFGKVTRSVEELPMLVGLQSFVPAERRDCFSASEKRIADHVAPGDGADTFLLTTMHPDAFAIHQWRKHRWPTAATLSHCQDVEFMHREVLANAVDVEIRRDNVIVVEQEDVPVRAMRLEGTCWSQ